MRLDGYRARQSLVGLSAQCANSYIPRVQHIIQYICAELFLDNAFLDYPVSILHPSTIFKWFLYTLVCVFFPFIAKRLLE